MMMQTLTERQQAICELLLRPDPDDLPTRGNHATQSGKDDRYEGVVSLVRAFIAHRRIERDQ